MKTNKNLLFMSILFSIIYILIESLRIVLGMGLLGLGSLTSFLMFLLLPLVLIKLSIYSIKQISTHKLAALLPLIIVLFGVGISFLIDPVKVDFYLYINQREQAVTLIEAGQRETVEQLIENNPSLFHVRSVFVTTNFIYDEKDNIEKELIKSIYLERYTVGFGDYSRGYTYTKDKEHTALLNRIKAKPLKEHWYWK